MQKRLIIRLAGSSFDLVSVWRGCALALFCFSPLASLSGQEVKGDAKPVTAGPSNAGKMRDRITDEQLKEARKTVPSTLDKAKAKPVDPPTAAVKRDVYQISDVLVDGGFHTVVPRGAVLSVPESLADRLASGPAGKFQFWPDFYARNKNWIKLQEVDVEVARGKMPIPENVIKMMETEPKMVLAVYKGNPITVLEAAAPEGAVEKAEEKK